MKTLIALTLLLLVALAGILYVDGKREARELNAHGQVVMERHTELRAIAENLEMYKMELAHLEQGMATRKCMPLKKSVVDQAIKNHQGITLEEPLSEPGIIVFPIRGKGNIEEFLTLANKLMASNAFTFRSLVLNTPKGSKSTENQEPSAGWRALLAVPQGPDASTPALPSLTKPRWPWNAALHTKISTKITQIGQLRTVIGELNQFRVKRALLDKGIENFEAVRAQRTQFLTAARLAFLGEDAPFLKGDLQDSGPPMAFMGMLRPGKTHEGITALFGDHFSIAINKDESADELIFFKLSGKKLQP